MAIFGSDAATGGYSMRNLPSAYSFCTSMRTDARRGTGWDMVLTPEQAIADGR
ncbi:hypothetical protein [Burkholderia perseverans]|uniref:hypothetical protein n=1 Tax=Burkholderia perseverans TaxID=2615214 RepID=UPI001FED8862|nr:hypothetical protein [Burkholderia perseverans]